MAWPGLAGGAKPFVNSERARKWGRREASITILFSFSISLSVPFAAPLTPPPPTFAGVIPLAAASTRPRSSPAVAVDFHLASDESLTESSLFAPCCLLFALAKQKQLVVHWPATSSAWPPAPRPLAGRAGAKMRPRASSIEHRASSRPAARGSLLAGVRRAGAQKFPMENGRMASSLMGRPG